LKCETSREPFLHSSARCSWRHTHEREPVALDLSGKHAGATKQLKRAPVGTTFSFMLDQPARVSLAFRQKRSGRMDAGRCATPTRANRHNHACVRQVPVAALSFSGHA